METEKGTSGLTSWNSNHCTTARPVFKLCLESRGTIFEYWTLKSLSFQAKLEAYEGRKHRQPHDLSNRDYDPGYIHSFPPTAPCPIPHSTLPSPIEPSTNIHNFRVSSIINIWGCEGDSNLHKYWLNPTHVAWLLHDCEKINFFSTWNLFFIEQLSIYETSVQLERSGGPVWLELNGVCVISSPQALRHLSIFHPQ